MNSRTYSFRELVEETQLKDRTVRYYIYELISPSERKKGSHSYPKSVRDKIVFAAMVSRLMKQQKKRLSLEGLKRIIESAGDSVAAVADGREPLEILDVAATRQKEVASKIDRAQDRGEEVMPIDMRYVESIDSAKSASAYIQQHKSEFMSEQRPVMRRYTGTDDKWQSIKLGKDVSLQVKGRYSRKTIDQLTLLGPLIESILKEGKTHD